MKQISRFILFLLLSGLVLGHWPSGTVLAAESTIHVSVSGSMFGRIHTLSNLFAKQNPGIKVTITQEMSVDDVIAELLEKKTTVAMATRHLTGKEKQTAVEKGMDLVENLIGHGGIVIVTHPGNPLTDLTVDQVSMVFRGEITRWNQLGGSDQVISLVRTGGKYPGTTFFMQEDFLQGRPFAIKSTVENEFSAILRKVAETPGSIGYARIRDVFESTTASEFQIKVLKIRKDSASPAVMPSRSTVGDGTYPIRRPYYLYLESKVNGEVKKFVDFILKKGWGQQSL